MEVQGYYPNITYILQITVNIQRDNVEKKMEMKPNYRQTHCLVGLKQETTYNMPNGKLVELRIDLKHR